MTLAKKLSSLAPTLTNKPEAVHQVTVYSESIMTFGGSEAPTAFIKLNKIKLADLNIPAIA